MAYDVATVTAQRDAAMDRLSDAISSPKMDYQIAGQSFNWTQYQRMLQEQIDWCNTQLRQMSGPEYEETIVEA